MHATRADLSDAKLEAIDASGSTFAEARLVAAGLQTSGIDDTICCYAEKVETWVEAPDGNRWEWYVKQWDNDERSENIIVEHRLGAAGGAPKRDECCS